MSINGCEKLMLRLKNGDMSAFDKIYEQTNQAVFFSALRILRDRVRAEDIMQEVYINLIEKIALYNEGNAIGFLVTMAKRMALNELKRAKREVLTDYSEIDFVDPRAF
ncbi:MAG: sigma factor, partial [Clostridia bacterium]